MKVDEESEPKDNINLRQYGVGAQILSDLGVKKMILLSNSKKRAIGLKEKNIYWNFFLYIERRLSELTIH